MEKATFDQATHLLELVKQKERSGSCNWLQDLYDSGILSDVFAIPDPKKVNRVEVQRVFGILPSVGAVPAPPKPLLEPIGTVVIPATTKQFVARKRFVADTGRKARVKISWLGDDFKAWFLNKIEEPAAEATLRSAKLPRSSVDEPILTELDDTAETTLGEMFSLLERQPNGERGTLLNDDRANIFYVLDVAGALRVVGLYWRGDGWGVHAHSVGSPFPWFDGSQVFSRNSSVAQTV